MTEHRPIRKPPTTLQALRQIEEALEVLGDFEVHRVAPTDELPRWTYTVRHRSRFSHILDVGYGDTLSQAYRKLIDRASVREAA